ncbi:hypothetical protein QJQ45_018718, partial [Haematococcus lacustris]
AHILALKATWDALWEEYPKPRGRRQRLGLFHAHEHVIEGFCKKVVEGMKWVSCQHYHQERGVALFLGAGRFSQGGWKANAVREGFCKVVEQPSRPSTDARPDRLVIADEFRTSRLCTPDSLRIGESMQRALELCSWKDREALPTVGTEYQQRYKRVNDRLPKFSKSQVEVESQAYNARCNAACLLLSAIHYLPLSAVNFSPHAAPYPRQVGLKTRHGASMTGPTPALGGLAEQPLSTASVPACVPAIHIETEEHALQRRARAAAAARPWLWSGRWPGAPPAGSHQGHACDTHAPGLADGHSAVPVPTCSSIILCSSNSADGSDAQSSGSSSSPAAGSETWNSSAAVGAAAHKPGAAASWVPLSSGSALSAVAATARFTSSYAWSSLSAAVPGSWRAAAPASTTTTAQPPEQVPPAAGTQTAAGQSTPLPPPMPLSPAACQPEASHTAVEPPAYEPDRAAGGEGVTAGGLGGLGQGARQHPTPPHPTPADQQLAGTFASATDIATDPPAPSAQLARTGTRGPASEQAAGAAAGAAAGGEAAAAGAAGGAAAAVGAAAAGDGSGRVVEPWLGRVNWGAAAAAATAAGAMAGHAAAGVHAASRLGVQPLVQAAATYLGAVPRPALPALPSLPALPALPALPTLRPLAAAAAPKAEPALPPLGSPGACASQLPSAAAGQVQPGAAARSGSGAASAAAGPVQPCLPILSGAISVAPTAGGWEAGHEDARIPAATAAAAAAAHLPAPQQAAPDQGPSPAATAAAVSSAQQAAWADGVAAMSSAVNREGQTSLAAGVGGAEELPPAPSAFSEARLPQQPPQGMPCPAPYLSLGAPCQQPQPGQGHQPPAVGLGIAAEGLTEEEADGDVGDILEDVREVLTGSAASMTLATFHPTPADPAVAVTSNPQHSRTQGRGRPAPAQQQQQGRSNGSEVAASAAGPGTDPAADLVLGGWLAHRVSSSSSSSSSRGGGRGGGDLQGQQQQEVGLTGRSFSTSSVPDPGQQQQQQRQHQELRRRLSKQAGVSSPPPALQAASSSSLLEGLEASVVGTANRQDASGQQYTLYRIRLVQGGSASWECLDRAPLLTSPAFDTPSTLTYLQVRKRFSEFVQLKKALVAAWPPGPGPAPGGLPSCWDRISQGRGVLGSARMSLAVIEERQELLQHCLDALLPGAGSNPWVHGPPAAGPHMQPGSPSSNPGVCPSSSNSSSSSPGPEPGAGGLHESGEQQGRGPAAHGPLLVGWEAAGGPVITASCGRMTGGDAGAAAAVGVGVSAGRPASTAAAEGGQGPGEGEGARGKPALPTAAAQQLAVFLGVPQARRQAASPGQGLSHSLSRQQEQGQHRKQGQAQRCEQQQQQQQGQEQGQAGPSLPPPSDDAVPPALPPTLTCLPAGGQHQGTAAAQAAPYVHPAADRPPPGSQEGHHPDPYGYLDPPRTSNQPGANPPPPPLPLPLPPSGEQGAGGPPPLPCLSTTIRLRVDLLPKVPQGELVSSQGGRCAGCGQLLPLEPSQGAGRAGAWLSLGGGSSSRGPRRCRYTGRLYCHDCHHNALHLIPALVLQRWDFRARPVSCEAAEYLAAVQGQPLLCVSAVNPALYTRVPALQRARQLRQHIAQCLAAAQAAGGEVAARAARLTQAAGNRAYLMDPGLSDFWAMRDLAELSKGAFSQLPPWLEAAAMRAAALAAATGHLLPVPS